MEERRPVREGSPMRVLAIAIAHGFSSEVRVMSTLIGNAPSVDASIVVHSWHGNTDAARRVRDVSGADVYEFDLGWRPSDQGPSRRTRLTLSVLRVVWAFPHLIRIGFRTRPDVVYSSQQKWDCAVASILSMVLRRPHVVHLHYAPGPWLGRFAMRRLRSADLVIGVSEFIKGLAIAAGTSPDRAVAVLNPAPTIPEDAGTSRHRLRAEMGIGENEVAIGNVSRLSPWKGQLETITAFSRLGRDLDHSRLILVGEGEFREELEELVRRLGVTDRVMFLGARDDVPSLLTAFDIFVHPSYGDPCPLAVLEAQAAGLPTVAFDEGGIPEIVVDGETGLLAPNRDPDELAARLQRLISDPQLRDTMGRAAAIRARTTFDPSRAGETFASVVAQIGRTGSSP